MCYSTVVNVWWYYSSLDKFYILFSLSLSAIASFFSSFPLFFSLILCYFILTPLLTSLSRSSLPPELGWIRSGHGVARSVWARRIPMGLFDFLLLIFVFWVWMGWIFGFLWIGILDSNEVWVGFGLVGWVGVVGNGLFGCFCYGLVGFLVGFVLFFLFWVLVPVGLVSRGQWWVVGCLVVFAMGLLGFWWVLFCFFYFGFFVPMGLVSKRQWWVVGCLVVFAMGLLGLWWLFNRFCFVLFFCFFFLVLFSVGLDGRGQWWRGGDCLFGCWESKGEAWTEMRGIENLFIILLYNLYYFNLLYYKIKVEMLDVL